MHIADTHTERKAFASWHCTLKRKRTDFLFAFFIWDNGGCVFFGFACFRGILVGRCKV